MALWAQSALEARLGVETVRRILDDNNDGSADTNAVERLQKDSDSKVLGYCVGIYELSQLLANPPNELVRLSLDVAVAMASMRHATYVRHDGEKLMRMAEADLKRLRIRETQLDVEGTPEPARNEGGFVGSGNPTCPTPKPKMFLDGTGDF